MSTPGDPELHLTGQSNPEVSAPARERLHNALGTGIAIALGGGFSRGFAHLGVLEVLDQERIPISVIVGTSIGGLLGAAYADGLSVQELCEIGRNVRVRDLLRLKSLHVSDEQHEQKTDGIGRLVRKWFHSDRVEDLNIPTAIVTTNLDTAEPYVFTHGPLETALRASCAFPGLFKPVEYQDRLLADGCIVAPIPTAVAARMGAACVLGVDVGANQKSAPSGRETVQVYPRALRGSHQGPSWIKYADIVLEPDVRRIDWNNFSRVDDARAAGVAAMRIALPHVRRLLDRQSRGQTIGGASERIKSELAS